MSQNETKLSESDETKLLVTQIPSILVPDDKSQFTWSFKEWPEQEWRI